jgi:hypothetical protein
MAYQTWLADALQDAGVDVITYTGWQTRGSSSFSPNGLVLHHTGRWSSVSGMVNLCINGYGDLPGPLCQVVLDPTGACHVIAAGRANHAGAGGWKGLSGNTSVLGIEAIHDGATSTPWPPAQRAAFVVAAAALARRGGFGSSMICGHREWAPARKIDPTGINLDTFRTDVTKLVTPAKAVAPMYDPPLPIAAVLFRPGTNDVVAAVAPDGAMYCWGVPYQGGANGKSYFAGRRAAMAWWADDPEAVAARRLVQPAYEPVPYPAYMIQDVVNAWYGPAF